MADKKQSAPEKVEKTTISRRNFLKGVGTGTVAAAVAPTVSHRRRERGRSADRRSDYERDDSIQHQREDVSGRS